MKYHQHMLRALRRLPSLMFLTAFILMISWTSPAYAQVAVKKFSISFKDKALLKSWISFQQREITRLIILTM